MQRHRVEVEVARLVPQQRQTQLLLQVHLLQPRRGPLHLLVLADPPRVVELVADVHELDRGGVPVYVDEGPERAPGLDAAEEDALLLAVDAEVDVARRGHVVEEDGVLAAEALGQGLGPVAGLVR